MMTFDQLIAPMTVGEFLRDVHGRTHKLLRGAAGRFAGLLTWRDLNRILAEHRLDHPRLRLCGAGGADHDGFVHHSLRRGVLRVPRLDAAALQQRLRDGATLILNDVDELHTPIGRLALALERGFREAVHANLYAAWRDQQGFHLHWDDHDVLVVQIAGRKRWRVYGPTRPAPLTGDGPSMTPPSAPLWEGELRDGDVLYLPRGCWHEACGVGEPTVHVSFAIPSSTGVDFLEWFVGQLRDDVAARENLPRFSGREARAGLVAHLRALVVDRLDDAALDRYLAEHDAHLPARPILGLPWAATPDAAPPEDGAVRLVPPVAVIEREVAGGPSACA